jgi:hypothetical protein
MENHPRLTDRKSQHYENVHVTKIIFRFTTILIKSRDIFHRNRKKYLILYGTTEDTD